jgi:hypothetical protein
MVCVGEQLLLSEVMLQLMFKPPRVTITPLC